MKIPLLVSIVINNYNYGRFLGDAIDSALQQSYQPLEVIVVDDGSTDSSRTVIEQYDDRIIAAFKENGGQASALNAGFALSHGDIIIFLDADDCLLPDLVDRVVHVYHQRPRLVNVIYRLGLTDGEGRSYGRTIPPAYLALPDQAWSGLPFRTIMNSASWAPTSGNAFAASTLHHLMPIPEEPFRLSADYYLCRLSALCGTVASLPTIGGYYRLHGANTYHQSTLDLERVRYVIQFVQTAHSYLLQSATALDIETGDAQIRDEIHLAQRLISCRLDPAAHPFPQDSPTALCRQGITAALQRPDLPSLQKAIHVVWFAMMIASPQTIARSLARRFFSGTRPALNDMLAKANGSRQQASGRP